MHDLIIIGAGPAGITAGIYAIRKGIKPLIITNDIGGQTAWSSNIENYTGYQFISGPQLVDKFNEHIRAYNVSLNNSEKVQDITSWNNIFQVRTNKAEYQAKTVIIASGKCSKKLNVPGEKEFRNRGVTYCATCDGPLFKSKDVAVIGSGNSGLDAVIQLLSIANNIYLIETENDLLGDLILQEKIKTNSKVKILTNTQVQAVLGEKMVNAVKIHTNGHEQAIKVQGVFIEIGLVPNTDFINIVEKNKLGEIKVNSCNQTNIPGLFAAGDVTDVPEKQIIIAAGEGSKAALSAFRYLTHQK